MILDPLFKWIIMASVSVGIIHTSRSEQNTIGWIAYTSCIKQKYKPNLGEDANFRSCFL